MAYRVFAAVFIHNVTYIYYAIISRVMCVSCAKLLVSVVLLLLEHSVGVGGGNGGVFPSTCISVCFSFLFVGRFEPRFSAIVKSDVFIYCRDSMSIVACISFVKLYYLRLCEVVAGLLLLTAIYSSKVNIFFPSERSLLTPSVVFSPPSRTAHDRMPANISIKYVANCHGIHFPLFVNYYKLFDNTVIPTSKCALINFKLT